MTTEQQVRRAAVELFARRGFHATGIRELADAAGINSSTLYHYMGTKDDLLFAIVQDSSQRLIEAARRITAPKRAPDVALCALVHMHVTVHATYPAETAVVDTELRSLAAAPRTEAVAQRDEYERFFTKAIAAGCRAGTFRVRDRQLARLAILSMCSGVVGWYSPTGRARLAEVAATHAQMALGLLGCQRSYESVVGLLAVVDVQAVVDEVWSSAQAPTVSRSMR